MVRGSSIDWKKLEDRIFRSVRFLDNIIEVNNFPLPQVRDMTMANRKIGLGVMGFADMLIKLGIPYNSKKALLCARKLMKFFHAKSLLASSALAEERGTFPNFKKSIYSRCAHKLRNATVNTIAPTGTISIIAGCSSGIEPLFAISFVRNVLSGTKLFEVNTLFEEVAKKRGCYSKEMLVEIAQHGSLSQVRGIPRDIKKLFVTAFDVLPQQHLQIQAAFQKYCDNAVSKTINLPLDATVDDVRRIYTMAHRLRCKGITIYRYGSKERQVLSLAYGEGRQSTPIEQMLAVEAEYSGGCSMNSCLF